MKFDARIQNVLADRLFIDHAIFCVPSRGLETMFTDTVDHFPGCPAADDLIEEVLDNSRLTYGQEYNAWFAVPLTVPTAEQQAIGAVVNAKAPGPLRLYSSFIGLASTQRDFSQLAVGQAIVSPTTPLSGLAGRRSTRCNCPHPHAGRGVVVHLHQPSQG